MSPLVRDLPASLLVAWAGVYCGAVMTAFVRLLARERRRVLPATPEILAETMLVRPCAGAEPGLDERLSWSGGARHVVLAVRDRHDTALPAIRRAERRLRADGVHVEIALTSARGPNQKASQLAHVLSSRPSRFVAVADSDVELHDVVIAELVGELGARELGALWAPFVLHARGVGGGVLDGSLHAFPLLAGLDGGGFVGKCFVARREALDAAGGFEAVADRLGEDVALARNMRAAGFTTGSARTIVSTRGSAPVDRFERWALVVRGQRPLLLLGYPAVLAAAPLIVALAALSGGTLGWTAATLVLVFRLLVAFAFAPRTGLARSLAADLVLLYAAARAVVWPRTEWRGRQLRIARGGRLVSEEPGEADEHSLGRATEESGSRAMNDLEPLSAGDLVGARVHRMIDARQRFLQRRREIRLGRHRVADRDPELGPLLGAEGEARRDRNDRTSSEPGDRGGARPELEGHEGRALSTLRVDDDEPSRSVEEPCGKPDRSRAITAVAKVDPEGPDLREEREASKVRRIHHGVRIGVELHAGEPQGNERIPPRGVVGDEEDRTRLERGAQPIAARELDPAEGPVKPRARVAREQPREPARPRRRDHVRSPTTRKKERP